ncbi:MAG: hypothetical protein FWE77_00365 [Clostridia bacterium]|nr:hypothetical protein [Clostridia bacterium]
MAEMERLLSVSEPWLAYCIRLHLLHEDKGALTELKREVLQDKRIQAYLADAANFHGVLVRNHKNPELPIHRLLFLLDIGLGRDVPEIERATGEIMRHKDGRGIYQSLTNVPTHFGGMGEDVFGWCLCDAPLLLLALLKAGIAYDRHIKQGADSLAGLCREQGFPCAVSPEHGKFRGPGRKDDCCPYATLAMLRLLAEIPEYQNKEVVRKSVHILLSLWENSLQRHPYMFYMGTDFRKLKAPAMWYDIVSVADCLSKFACAKEDARFMEMVRLIEAKRGEDGLFVPEAVYLKCKGWDFGQKKAPSPYLTFLCERIMRRLPSAR